MKKWGFKRLPDDVGFVPNLSQLLQKTSLSYASETLATYVRIFLHTHAIACIRKPQLTYAGRGPLWSFYFSKIDFFSHLKGYIFHFNTPQVTLISGWALT